MKVLVTGMTSRMTSFSRESGFPSLLARALSIFGHDVTMMVEYGGIDTYDAVFAGIASPLAPSSSYLVQTAQTISEAQEQGKLAAVFLDDPELKKIGYGADSTLRKPERLQKSFYMKRPGMQAFADDQSIRDTVLGFIEQLAAWGWEDVLWPGHSWATDYVAAEGTEAFRSVPVDPTAALDWLCHQRWPVDDQVPGRAASPGDAWVAETTYFQDHEFDPSIERQVYALATGENVAKTAEMFAMGYGVLHGNEKVPGWWTPFPHIAALTTRIYLPHPAEGVLMGDAYYRLPSAVEQLSEIAYGALVAAQEQQHKEHTWQRKQLHTALEKLLGAAVS